MSVEVGDLHVAITAPGATEAEGALRRVDKAAEQTGKTTTQAMAAFEKSTKNAIAATTQLAAAQKRAQSGYVKPIGDDGRAKEAAAIKAAMVAEELAAHRRTFALSQVVAGRKATTAAIASERAAVVAAASAEARASTEQAAASRREVAGRDAEVRALQAKERELNRAANAARRAENARTTAPGIARAVAGPAQLGPALPLGLQLGPALPEGFGAAAAGTGLLSGGLMRLVPWLAAVGLGANTLRKALTAYAQVADEARATTNHLRGAAIDAGVSFSEMVRRSDALRQSYNLTRGEAGELAATSAKLEKESGRVGISQDALNAALTVGRARGLDAAETADLYTAAVKGNGDAIAKLTGMQPEQLYAKMAQSIGTTADKLSDTGKAQALFNGLMAESARRATDAKAALDPLVESQKASANAMTDLKVAIGETLTPWRTLVNNMETDLARLATRTIPHVTRLLAIMFGGNAALASGAGLKKPAQAAETQNAGITSALGWVGSRTYEDLDITKQKTKELRDTTDTLIAALVTLHEAGKLNAAMLERANVLYAREKKILDDNTQSIERRAEALRRMRDMEGKDGKGGAGIITPGAIIPMPDPSRAPLKFDTTAPSMMPKTELRDENSFTTDIEDLWQTYQTLYEAAGMRATAESTAALTAYSREMTKQIMAANRRAMEDEFIAAFANLPMAFHNVIRDAFRTGGRSGLREGLSSLGDGVGSVFGDLGATIATKGTDSVLKGLGTFFKKVGLSIGIFGKLMSSLQKAMATHPLLAGAAAIGIGIAVSRLGASIAGASGGNSGGFDGGGIGGFATNAPGAAPQLYTFGGSQRTPSSPGTAASAMQPITVNATIIGPNDVRAQRQITELIQNAAYRGYGTDPNSRT